MQLLNYNLLFLVLSTTFYEGKFIWTLKDQITDRVTDPYLYQYLTICVLFFLIILQLILHHWKINCQIYLHHKPSVLGQMASKNEMSMRQQGKTLKMERFGEKHVKFYFYFYFFTIMSNPCICFCMLFYHWHFFFNSFTY